MSNLNPDNGVRPHAYQHYIDEMDVQLHRFVASVGQQPDQLTDIMTFLMRDLEEQQFVLMGHSDEYARLWGQIRSGPKVWTDLVIELTSALMFRVSAEGQSAYADLATALSQAFGCMALVPSNPALADDDSQDRFAKPEVVMPLLMGNPWVAALYLARQTEFIQRLLTDAATKETKA